MDTRRERDTWFEKKGRAMTLLRGQKLSPSRFREKNKCLGANSEESVVTKYDENGFNLNWRIDFERVRLKLAELPQMQ